MPHERVSDPREGRESWGGLESASPVAGGDVGQEGPLGGFLVGLGRSRRPGAVRASPKARKAGGALRICGVDGPEGRGSAPPGKRAVVRV